MSDAAPDTGPRDGAATGTDSAADGAIASTHAVFSISVASELSGVEPQMLRVYEQRGLLSPFRTDGGTRRYSTEDLERVALITGLLGEGLNLAGIGHVLELRAQTNELADELGELRATTGPNRREVRRLRRENEVLKARIASLQDPRTSPDDHQSAPSTS